jgi:hypothetical protein
MLMKYNLQLFYKLKRQKVKKKFDIEGGISCHQIIRKSRLK